MPQNILITGATGLIGSALIKKLEIDGANVFALSQQPEKIDTCKAFHWDVQKQQIDKACMKGIDTIIHIAGAPIAEKKWTEKRKQDLIDSRVESTKLLYKTIKTDGDDVKNFISASAVGYYGDRKNEILTEISRHGEGFVSECCIKWEDAVDEGIEMDVRIVKFRTGIVLAKEGGSLPIMAKPISLYVGAPLGSGKQWVPWIHIDDIVQLYAEAATNHSFSGVYNACAPYPVTNAQITHQIAKRLNRPVWPINVPETVLNVLLGERSVLPLMSNRISAQKLIDKGYKFNFPKVEEALADIYK